MAEEVDETKETGEMLSDNVISYYIIEILCSTLYFDDLSILLISIV